MISAASPFASRNFRRFYLASFVSYAGWWAQGVGQSWLILDLGGGGTGIGSFLALRFLPLLLLGAWAGTLADRVDVRRMLLLTQAISAAIAGVLAVLVGLDVMELWMFFPIALVDGLNSAFDKPAGSSFLVELVGRDGIGAGVGLVSALNQFGRVIGPLLGGMLLSLGSAEWCFLVNAVSYLAMVAVLAVIDVGQLHRRPPVPREPGQVRAGFRYAFGEPGVLVPLVTVACIGTFAFNFGTVLPLLAADTFDGGPTMLSLAFAAFGAGSVVGSLWAARRPAMAGTSLVWPSASFGIVMVVMAALPYSPLSFVALAVMGFFSMRYWVLTSTAAQMAAHPNMRGRVIAMLQICLLGTTPIGAPIMGALAEWVGPPAALLAGAASCFAAAGLALVLSRRFARPSSAEDGRAIDGPTEKAAASVGAS